MNFLALESFISVPFVVKSAFLEAVFIGIFRNFIDFLLHGFRHFSATKNPVNKKDVKKV